MRATPEKRKSMWSITDKYLRKLGCFALLMAMLHAKAFCGPFDAFSIDARSLSLSNTIVSSPEGISSIHYNPAGLSLLKGEKNVSVTFSGIRQKISGSFENDADFGGFINGTYSENPLDGTSGTTEDVRLYLPITGETDWKNGVILPTLCGFSYRKEDSPWTVANGLYIPYFYGYTRDNDDPMRYSGKSFYVEHLVYLSPSLSYDISDFFSIGVSVCFGQTAMGSEFTFKTPEKFSTVTQRANLAEDVFETTIESPLSDMFPWFGGSISPFDALSDIRFSGTDNMSTSVNVGLLFQTARYFSFGISYQSKITAKMTGDYTINNYDIFQQAVSWLGSTEDTLSFAEQFNLPETITAKESGACAISFTIPAKLQIGATFRPVKKLRLMTDLHWIEGSSSKGITIRFDQDIQLLEFLEAIGGDCDSDTLFIPLKMEDTLYFSHAVEFLPTDRLTLRCGYEDRKSCYADQYYSLFIPMPDMDVFGVGIGFLFKNGVKIDIAGSYTVKDRFHLSGNASRMLNSANPDDVIYNPYAGLLYEQDTEIFQIALTISTTGDRLF